MSENTSTNGQSARKKPDYVCYAVRSQAGSGPKYTRLGVGFNYKNGSIGVMYDAVPLSGQFVLLEMDAEKPATLSYSAPARKADFEASMVREGGGNSYWTDIGLAYRQDGYISVLCDVVPTGGKIVLSAPRDNA